jgi:SnoaL-like domain
MTREQARAIEWDCAQILIRFFNEFDAWRYREMAALFAPDGVWQRQGRALRGADAILAVLEQRSTTQTARHVVTNVQVKALDADKAQSLLYVTAYQHDTGEQATAPPVIRSPSLLLVVPGELVRTEEGWRISSLTMTRVFEFQP